MKKLVLLLISVLLITGCSVEKEEDVNLEQLRFVEDYESINGSVKEKEVLYHDVDIVEDNKVKYVDSGEVIDVLENGTGVVFFGFPECQWCRNMVSTLSEVVSDSGVETLYYFNDTSIRDTRSLDDDGNIAIDKEGSEDYYKILEILGDDLDSYSGLNDETIKRLYFPTVVFMLDGEIIGVHKGTVDSHTNGDTLMTEDQLDELEYLLLEKVSIVDGSVCADEVETGC